MEKSKRVLDGRFQKETQPRNETKTQTRHKHKLEKEEKEKHNNWLKQHVISNCTVDVVDEETGYNEVR